jgi:hypothetical protein
MKRVTVCRSPVRCIGVGVVALVWSVAAAAAQSPPLGEVARQEAERRREQPAAAKIYTNKDLPPSAQDRGPLPSAYPDTSDQASAAPAPEASAQPSGKVAGPGEEPVRNQAWWRDRIGQVRERLRVLEEEAEALQSRINVLSRDFVSRDNPVQRTRIGEERAVAIEELARARDAIALGRQEIADIEEEARRASVPPGWLR